MCRSMAPAILSEAIVTYAQLNMCTSSKKSLKSDVGAADGVILDGIKEFNYKKGAQWAPLIDLINLMLTE
ncbi:MAG: hypothetical protein ACI8SJ_001998 [Shewanella sp.]|jgi:hypothetical protein